MTWKKTIVKSAHAHEFTAPRNLLGAQGRVLGQVGKLTALPTRLSLARNITPLSSPGPLPAKHKFIYAEIATTPARP